MPGEEGNKSSATEEQEVRTQTESVHSPAPAQIQPSLSVNDISADLTEEATGSQNTTESNPGTEMEVAVEDLIPLFGFLDESEVVTVSRRVIQSTVCQKVAEIVCCRCLIICYCSEECQLDWIAHHHTCCHPPLDERFLHDLDSSCLHKKIHFLMIKH